MKERKKEPNKEIKRTLLLFISKSSPKLAESGKTLSASPPLDSLPGVGEGITKVTSICGITQPNIKDFFVFC